MNIRQEFRDFLSGSKINETKLDESVISAIVDTVKLFGYKKDYISYTKNSQKNFEKISIFDNDIHKLEKLKKERQELLNKFLYLSPYETMAYAYQFVKEYKSLSPSGIINKLKENGILINNLTKKYIAMYWIIRNKI